MADKVQVDYGAMAQVAADNRRQAEEITALFRKLNGQAEVVAASWVGESAKRFQTEMREVLLPAIERLYRGLELAGGTVNQISTRMRAAEDETAALFTAGASTTAAGTSGAPQSPAAAPGAADQAGVDRAAIRDRIEQHEGREAHVYPDTEGHPTIGVGFNLDRPGARQAIEALGLNYDDVRAGRVNLTDQQIDRLRDADVDTAIRDARALFPNFDTLTAERQRALTDMAFALGRGGLGGFHDLRDAVAHEDWQRAADEIADSDWARELPRRAGDNIRDMRGGPPHP